MQDAAGWHFHRGNGVICPTRKRGIRTDWQPMAPPPVGGMFKYHDVLFWAWLGCCWPRPDDVPVIGDWVVRVVVTTDGTVATLVSPVMDVVTKRGLTVVVKCLLEIWVAVQVRKAVPNPLVGSAVTALKVPLVKVVVAVRASKAL